MQSRYILGASLYLNCTVIGSLSVGYSMNMCICTILRVSVFGGLRINGLADHVLRKMNSILSTRERD